MIIDTLAIRKAAAHNGLVLMLLCAAIGVYEISNETSLDDWWGKVTLTLALVTVGISYLADVRAAYAIESGVASQVPAALAIFATGLGACTVVSTIMSIWS